MSGIDQSWQTQLNRAEMAERELAAIKAELMTLYPADTNGDAGVVIGVKHALAELKKERDSALAVADASQELLTAAYDQRDKCALEGAAAREALEAIAAREESHDPVPDHFCGHCRARSVLAGESALQAWLDEQVETARNVGIIQAKADLIAMIRGEDSLTGIVGEELQKHDQALLAKARAA